MATRKGPAPPRGWTTLEVVRRGEIALIGLARPKVHNAFDEALIAELTEAVRQAGDDADVRVIVLHGTGESFCAGADLDWMKRMAGYGHAENLADAKALAAMLSTIAGCPKPTVAVVNGAAYGGGVGLIACCDIAIGASDAQFALSEVKLGLIPATIGPYVVAAIGVRHAQRYFVSGERFTAAEAFRIGLLHDIAPPGELDARVNEVLGALLLAGPQAQREAKLLVRAVAHRAIDASLIADTAERIARIRATDEAREGIAAFLGKRSPAWVPKALRGAGRKR
jgi:methylglutaconyl-CoA hydratase